QNASSPNNGETRIHVSDGELTPGKRRWPASSPHTTHTAGNDPSTIRSRGTDTLAICRPHPLPDDQAPQSVPPGDGHDRSRIRQPNTRRIHDPKACSMIIDCRFQIVNRPGAHFDKPPALRTSQWPTFRLTSRTMLQNH